MRSTLVLSIAALAFLPATASAQDFMKYMKPYEESPADLQIIKQLNEIDATITAHDKEKYDQAVERFRALKPRKALNNIARSKTPQNRALAVMGYRLLPAKRIWDELRFMLMDSEPMVRRQCMLYAAEFPQGITLDGVTMPLSDGSPDVRIAAIFAVAKVAKKKEDAAALFRKRLKEEKDPNVIGKLKVGFALLGMPAPED